MLMFLSRFLGLKSQKRNPARYEREKQALQSQDTASRLALASGRNTHQEILYYLAAQDPDPKVRQAVAQNPAMPVQVGTVLAKDANVDVRMALAQRLVDLLPDLSRDHHSQIYAYAVQALGMLALDEVLKVRKALSSTLKDHAHTPPKIAGRLARDMEREVSEPILRFCAALADDDLLDILKGHPSSWVVQAVAARATVSVPVSQAVIETGDRPAGLILIQNEGAQFADSTLKQIIERAREFPEWQRPVALRKNLSPEAARLLADFVDESVRGLLDQLGEFDSNTTDEIAAVTRRRIDFVSGQKKEAETVLQFVTRLHYEGRLSEEIISDALAMHDREFVIAALACLTRSTVPDISRIFETHAPRSIVAVTWKAGLGSRLALQLQKELGHVSPKDLLYPRNGTDFPLTDDEIRLHLRFLGMENG